ncbi:MAG: replicative DNA helicase [Ilumatobacteraceae bacterium]
MSDASPSGPLRSVPGGKSTLRPNPATRVPPHNLIAEESLLGAMMLSRDAVTAVSEMRLTSDAFYKPAHQHIYEAMRSLLLSGDPVDPVTVSNQLRRSGLLDEIGGMETLVRLQNSTPVIGNASRYAQIVVDTASLRRLISVASEIAEIAYSEPDNVATALDEAETKVFAVANSRVTDSVRPLGEVLREASEELDARASNQQAITGLATGFDELADITLGFQPPSLVILGARPAVGKSAFALNIARTVMTKSMRPVIFFSLEMSHYELAQRLLSSEAQVEVKRLRNGQIQDHEWSSINHAVGRMEQWPLLLDDNPMVSVLEMRAKARRVKQQYGDLGLVIIDYLQLMTGSSRSENRQVEVSEISRNLKILAREIDAPVLALSQLSRKLEERSEKRPQLSDLRESGAIEQDADIVMFLHREEVFKKEFDPQIIGVAELIISKHRSGETGTVPLVFKKEVATFLNGGRGSTGGEEI